MSVKSIGSDDAASTKSIGSNDSVGLSPDCNIRSPNMSGRLFDCLVLMVYCPRHKLVAVMNTKGLNFTCLPFCEVREDDTFKKKSAQEVNRIIGRQDAELDAEKAVKHTPKFTTHIMQIIRTQLANDLFIVRVCQLVKLIPDDVFECCTSNLYVEWVPIKNLVDIKPIVANSSDLWGPELKTWCTTVKNLLEKDPNAVPTIVVNEYPFHSTALNLFSAEDSLEYRAILGVKLKEIYVSEIYESFLKHCLPCQYMRYQSFYSFFIRQKKKCTDPIVIKKVEEPKKFNPQRLYDSFCFKRNDYIDFEEFLLGIIVMDPVCKDLCEARVRAMFRYYSQHKNYIDDNDLKRFTVDYNYDNSVQYNDNMSGLHSKTLELFKVEKGDKVTFTKFYRAVASNPVYTEKMLRLPFSILQSVSSNYAMRMRKKADMDKSESNSSRSIAKCLACQQSKYEYGIHGVTFNAEGRCTNPRVINKYWIEESMYHQNRIYSIEYTFSFRSIANIFIDFVREYNRNKVYEQRGLMATKGDWQFIQTYLRVLCHMVNGILLAESKLLKLNGSAIVIGDLQGNLADLCAFEEQLFPTFPVIPESLIFLGNYTGEINTGVECLIYLFSLKVLSPNKVFLLRGNRETDDQGYQSLREECFQKYGQEGGLVIFENLTDVFTRLPIAATIDETVLCVNSGIPSISRPISQLNDLPKIIKNTQKDAPLAYEMLTRIPYECNQDHEECDCDLAIRSGLSSDRLGLGNCLALKLGCFSQLISKSTDIPLSQIKSSAVSSVFYKCDNLIETEKSNSFWKDIIEKAAKSQENELDKIIFDRKSFESFMLMNELSYLIRTSILRTGFQMNFDRKCLTIYSSSVIGGEEAVTKTAILLERTTRRIRFVCLENTSVKKNDADTVSSILFLPRDTPSTSSTQSTSFSSLTSSTSSNNMKQ